MSVYDYVRELETPTPDKSMPRGRRWRKYNVSSLGSFVTSQSIDFSHPQSRGLATPWIVLLHWLPLSVTLNILSKSISVHWMMLCPTILSLAFLFPDKVPWMISFSLQLCLMMCDQNSVISLSLYLLTKFNLLPPPIKGGYGFAFVCLSVSRITQKVADEFWRIL